MNMVLMKVYVLRVCGRNKCWGMCEVSVAVWTAYSVRWIR